MARYNQAITLRGGTWRRHVCKRRNHELIVALTVDLTMQAICLRCRAAADVPGIAPTFTTTDTSPSDGAREDGRHG